MLLTKDGNFAKNCVNCKHLEYEPNECECSSVMGRMLCNKRGDSPALLGKLQLDSYLTKSKVCCELKQTNRT